MIGTSLGCHQQRALHGGERSIGTACCVEVGGKVQGFHPSRWALTPPWTAAPSPIRLLRLVPCQPSSPASARSGILRTPVSSAWGAGRDPHRSVIGAAGSAEPGAGVYKVGITPSSPSQAPRESSRVVRPRAARNVTAANQSHTKLGHFPLAAESSVRTGGVSSLLPPSPSSPKRAPPELHRPVAHALADVVTQTLAKGEKRNPRLLCLRLFCC